ncbi:MAG: hypothetical protein FJ288_14030, partial [Planctomycetes bacterium]|nr:hypothetical protein [Planctomycetota bacterium]
MKRMLTILAVLGIAAGAASAAPAGGVTITPSNPAPAAPAGGGVVITPSGPATPAAPGGSEEAQKVAAIQALLTAGEFDKAAEQAGAYLRTARDDAAKTEAMRILAEALRKKGDFRLAPAAYLRLRERFEKGSDDYVRYDGIAEVLKASPTGVYQPPGAPPVKPAPGAPAVTLADDGALA